MIQPLKTRDTGLWSSLPISLLFHIIVYGVLAWLHFLPSLPVPEGDVYYVDVVNLPVASPQAGTPSIGDSQSLPQPPAPQSAPEMKLPSRETAKPSASLKSKNGPAQEKAETAREFEERLARLEKASDARHAAAALESLQKRAQGTRGPAGMPKGTGSEAGSDYASYIRSRLADAFKTTIAYQSKHPETAVRLFIDKNGKLARIVMERSSKDRLFDDAVIRAVEKAKQTFPPPPSGKTFEKLFVFNPEEVTRQ